MSGYRQVGTSIAQATSPMAADSALRAIREIDAYQVSVEDELPRALMSIGLLFNADCAAGMREEASGLRSEISQEIIGRVAKVGKAKMLPHLLARYVALRTGIGALCTDPRSIIRAGWSPSWVRPEFATHFDATLPKISRMLRNHEVDLVHLHVAESGSFLRKANCPEGNNERASLSFCITMRRSLRRSIPFSTGGKDYVRETLESVDVNWSSASQYARRGLSISWARDSRCRTTVCHPS